MVWKLQRRYVHGLNALLLLSLAGCGASGSQAARSDASDAEQPTTQASCVTHSSDFALRKFSSVHSIQLQRPGWLFGVGGGTDQQSALSQAANSIASQIEVSVESDTRVKESVGSSGKESFQMSSKVRSRADKRLSDLILIASCSHPKTGRMDVLAGFNIAKRKRRAKAYHDALLQKWSTLTDSIVKQSGPINLVARLDLPITYINLYYQQN